MRKLHPLGTSTLAIVLALSLAGCGDKKAADAGAVAAKVNAEEITVSQLDHEVAKLGNLDPEQAKQAARQVLKTMVDQQLLVQKAIEEKLDADPAVLQAIEAGRRQVLAQAYIQKLSANAAAPGEAEIADYYAKHPELFSERRIYRLQEISIQAAPANVEAIKAQLAQSKNLVDFVDWLKAQGIPARAGQSTKAAEQVPLELLTRLHQLKDGQAITYTNGNMLIVVAVAGSQTQPMNQTQAKPVIERFLTNAKKRELASAEVKSLKEKAKIEFLGDFADLAKDAAAPAAAPSGGAGTGGQQ